MSQRSEHSRLEILEAAASVIARYGFHGMGMRKLAEATGRGLASFYNYFSSKDELLFEIQDRAFRTLIAHSRRDLDGLSDPEDRLYVFIFNHLRYVAEHRDVMRVLVHEGSSLSKSRRDGIRSLKERYFTICREIVGGLLPSDPVDPAELERSVYVIFGMVNWVYGWYLPEKHGDVSVVAATIHRLALRGLKSPAKLANSATELGTRLRAGTSSPLIAGES